MMTDPESIAGQADLGDGTEVRSAEQARAFLQGSWDEVFG
jgi:hypothetical protein